MAVNLSARQLDHDSLRATTSRQRWTRPGSTRPRSCSRSPRAMLIVERSEHASTCCSALQALGIRLAIDDFGTGYSSLSYLRRFPVDILKIDRSFITGLKVGEDAIVRSTIDLAHDLGLKVVAEGVESRMERDHLRELACDAAQGRYLAAPCAPLEARGWCSKAAWGYSPQFLITQSVFSECNRTSTRRRPPGPRSRTPGAWRSTTATR